MAPAATIDMREHLASLSNLWFWLLIASTIAVAVGIIFEAPEVFHALSFWRKPLDELRRFWHTRIRKVDLGGWERICPELVNENERPRPWMARVGLIGWLFVAVGVGAEGVAEYFVNNFETQIRSIDEGSLSDNIREAGAAKSSARGAAEAARDARTASSGAEKKSANALTLARGAQQEADSFEHDIASTKKQAAEAESHLAEAKERAASAEREAVAATIELNRLKTPRSLTNVPALVASLQKFSGTEYTFAGVFGDEESILLLRQIDAALQAAHWKRVKPEGIIVLQVFGKDADGVPLTSGTGITVSIESTESVDTLRDEARILWPLVLRAAIAAHDSILSDLAPPQGALHKDVEVEKGTSMVVHITVGKKS
jgi:hypothetical protein